MPICKDCHGTGADAKKTAEMKKKEASATGHVRCWVCNGNGLEPSYPGDYNRWKANQPQPPESKK